MLQDLLDCKVSILVLRQFYHRATYLLQKAASEEWRACFSYDLFYYTEPVLIYREISKVFVDLFENEIRLILLKDFAL